MRSACCRAGVPAPSAPTSSAGVPRSSTRAWRRVGSSVGSGVRTSVDPAVAASTTKTPRPAALRAATTSEVGGAAVEHVVLHAGQEPAARPALGRRGDGVEVPRARVLGQRERRDGVAGGQAGQVARAGRVVTGGEDRRRRQPDRREVGGADEGAPQLLEDDAELDRAVAGAAEPFRDGEALDAQLGRRALPRAPVPADGVVQQPPHLGLGPLLRQERTHHRTELLLLGAEREVH